MTTPMPEKPEDPLTERVNLLGMRLWIACALIIVTCGVANYLLSRMFPQ